jgi:hypothetical protein
MDMFMTHLVQRFCQLAFDKILGAWCGWEIPTAEPGFKWFEWEHVNYLGGLTSIYQLPFGYLT